MAIQATSDESRTQALYGSTISLILLATIAVIVRFFARKASAVGLWWDDFSIIVALILNWGLNSCYWIEVVYGGLGHHATAYGGPVDRATQNKFYQIWPGVMTLYFASSLAIKTSLLLLYSRIFGVIVWFRRLLLLVEVIAVFYFVAFFLLVIFQCQPIACFWNKSLQGCSCVNQKQAYRWNGILNLLIDFAIWSLPLPVIWRLKLDQRRKFSVSIIMCLGMVYVKTPHFHPEVRPTDKSNDRACVASVLRVVTFDNVNFDDPTFTLINANIWGVVEQSLGIICACLPTTWSLFRRIFSKISPYAKRNASDAEHFDIILPDYRQRQSMRTSHHDAAMPGFARLHSDNDLVTESTQSREGKTSSDPTPTMPQKTWSRRKPEQDVYYRPRST
ncbi:hypothetical protein ACLMJK_004296 [Lecanora helva]